VTTAKAIAKVLAAKSDEEQLRIIAQLSDAERTELHRCTEGLLEFIPRISPDLSTPRHLQPLVDAIESTLETPGLFVVSTPPQHGKTFLCEHAIVWLMQQNPKRRHAYATYETDRADKISDATRQLAARAGFHTTGTRKFWTNEYGGSLFSTGTGAGFTGEPVDGCLIVDDPHKNRLEAESGVYRQRADDWMRSVARTRMHPSASAIVVATRWHTDDLAGRMIDRGWTKIRLPAIDEHGKALWPEQRPLSFLTTLREELGEYDWASLYQGEPRTKGGAVFGDVHLYDPKSINWNGSRVALGVDCAYSAKTHANYSVGLVLVELGGLYYLREVQRHQVKTEPFKAVLDSLRKTYSIRKSRWYTSTTEEGTAELLGVTPELARGDKFVRAQPVAAAWNAGKVLVPEKAPWADAFVSEVVSFTGIDDPKDDQVDALAAAYDVLARPSASYDGLPSGVDMPKRRI